MTDANPDLLEISCNSCGATLRVERHHRTATCPYCASPSVIERPSGGERPDPSFALGFVFDQERARTLVRSWISRRGFFTRGDFKKAPIELVRGVYLPAYLYGAVADTTYSAEIGENYTVTETYTTTDSKGRTVTRTRTRTVTEWRSLEGRHSCYVIDVLVTASRGVSNAALEEIEPYDLRALRKYSPAIVSGWLTEDPSMTQDECFRLAHDESVEKVGGMLDSFMPGDSHRELQYHSHLSDETIDLVLLPLWSFASRYRADRPPIRILVNGQSGEVAGKVPISAIKVTLAVVLGLVVVIGIGLLIAGGGR